MAHLVDHAPTFEISPGCRVRGLPAFVDNYLWLIAANGQAVVVDPGDADVIASALAEDKLQLAAILITHHHPDHIGGVAELKARTGCHVYGPNYPRITVDTEVAEGDVLRFPALSIEFSVWAVPGHTRSHLAYYVADTLFVGDTIFAGGCGRVFEGEPATLFRSLRRIAALPASTRLCCAHEYTFDNLRFAREVEPDNATVSERYQWAGRQGRARQPTVPMTLGEELLSNPFLRTAEPGVLARVAAQAGIMPADAEQSFVALRAWKNQYVARHD